jgi:3-hydroxyacyl-CoA dehydrogenase/3a,7a,12a-trihydroxy-5b-cholest-24-enoyl-CoA hydratase
MKKQKYGRIVMTTSTSGIFGNYGQANYSAAKMGLVGLSNTLALEGVKYNIYCNAFAPIAGSRLTQGVMPPDILEQLKPDYVVPLVLYLCSEICEENGGVFQSAAGWHSKLRWQRTKGVLLHKKGIDVTPEMVRDSWEDITDWSGAENPTAQDAMAALTQVIDQKQTGQESGNVANKELSFSYSHRDVILYALGVGVSAKEDYSHLKFLYEGHEDFSVLPTFGVITSQVCKVAIKTFLLY